MTAAPVMSITDELVAELEAVARSAIPGPWKVQHPNAGPRGFEVAACGGLEQVAADLTAERAAFIACADPALILALLAERAELKSRVATMTGLLGDAEDELDSLAGMMEPYYSQCNADDDARRLIERIRAVLPPPYIPPPPPAITCQQCSGRKSKRVFIDDAALRNHTRSAHAMQAAK